MNKLDKESSYELVRYHTDLPFRILNVKKSYIYGASAPVNVQFHWHKELEIIYSYSQGASFVIDGKEYDSEKDMFTIINSNSIHGVLSKFCPKSNESPYLTTVINISDEFLRNVIPNYDVLYFKPVFRTAEKRPAQIIRELAKCGNADSHLGKYENMRLMGLVYELLYYLCKDDLGLKDIIIAPGHEEAYATIRNITAYVQDNFKNPVTEAETAKQFGFTPTYFSRFFRKYMGMPFREFLIRTRVSRAAEMLTQTNRQVLEIALDCGFSDARGLIKMFSKYEGMTPGQFRKAALDYSALKA